MTPVERLLSKLPDAKPAGKGWSARCPAHDDRRASLSIGECDDGRALVHCHAGCTPDAICAAIGLRVLDLMPTADKLPPNTVNVNGSHREPRKLGIPLTPKQACKTFPTAGAAVAELERAHGPRSALWTYHNAKGEPVGVVVRWDLADGKKEIRPVSRHGDHWLIGGMLAPRPLYGLRDLAGAKRVYVCEGEKAADALRSLGLTATTSAHGSQSAEKSDWRPLAGKEIIILPDNDAPGRKYADAVAALLARLMPAPVVKMVQLPDLPDHGDAADFVAAHSPNKAGELRRTVEAMADTESDVLPTKVLEPGPVLTCFADIEPCPVPWLWPGRMPLGRITLLVGRPGEGKSFLTIDAAARVTTGTPWPDGSDCPQGSVILISAEDDPADTIRPRLDVHYADVRRVHLLSAVRRIDGEGHYERLITLADVDAVEAALVKLPDCKLIVVDPVGSFLGGRTDAHRDNEVRGILAPIAVLAEKYGPAVLVVAHRRKSTGSIADDLALGSRAFTGIARAVWHVSRDPDNTERRLLLPGKSNLAREGDGLAFSIVGEPPRIAWQRDPVAMTADDALAAEGEKRDQKPGPEAEALEAAETWLRSVLASGPRLSKELFDEWKNGEGGSKRTLERAKASLHVKAFRTEVPGPWSWRLPANIAKPTEDVVLGNLGTLAKNTGILPTLEVANRKDAKLPESGTLSGERVRVTI